MLTFLALLSLVHGMGENLDLKMLIIILYGKVTFGFLDPRTVHKAMGKTKESRNTIFCPQGSMNQ